jgi:predicted MFS family arabinose efflux permease
LSFAFAFDAATFIFASLTLILMHLQPGFKAAESRSGSGSPSGVHGINLGTSGSLLTEIHDGLEYVIRHPLLGALLGLVAAVHFAIDAPVFVGVNALASNRFIGAENLGLMLSAWGGGALFGALIAGVWRVKNRGRVVLGLAALLGILFITLGFLPNLVLVTIDLALMGLANGFWSVVGLAWVQKVVPDEFRGRAMSVVMLASAGIVPFSYALSGWLADLSLTLMFIIAGAVILSTVVSAGRNRALRTM